MKITQIKKEWFNLDPSIRKAFWSNLYNPIDTINKLNCDEFPSIEDFSRFVYGVEKFREIRNKVAFEGIIKLRSYL